MEDNKKLTDEKKEEQKPAEDTGEGNKYETTPVIERAREEREKLEAATKAQKEQNDRTEQIMAKKALGGETQGATETVKKEISNTEYANEVMQGNDGEA